MKDFKFKYYRQDLILNSYLKKCVFIIEVFLELENIIIEMNNELERINSRFNIIEDKINKFDSDENYLK